MEYTCQHTAERGIIKVTVNSFQWGCGGGSEGDSLVTLLISLPSQMTLV